MIGEKLKLKDVCVKITKGTTPSTYGFPFVESGINYVKAESILESGGILPNTFAFIDEATHEYLKRSILCDKDILISIAGAKLGKCGFLTEQYLPANTNQAVGIVRVNQNTADPKFVYYNFVSSHTYQVINSLNSQAAQPNLNLGQLGELEFKFPPLPSQRRIASILSAYDDLIENNLKRIKLLEEKAAIVYSTEFGNYQVSNKEFTSLPKRWSVKTIGEIFGKLESGSRPKGGIDKELKEGIASVGAENVIGLGKYNYQSEKLITLAFFENMNRGIIEDRDILIYKDGAYIGKTTLFQDVFPHEKCCVNEHVFLLTSKDVRYQYFLFFTLNQRLYFEKMQQLNANAAQPGINQESLKSLKLIWPSVDKIVEFNKEVETSVKLIFVLAKQNTKLREARDILLPKLMSGQIEV
ncbi:MAG: restriction endonuclease subunit S [Chitinophagaceae bacterium]|nr:restriction endonuclease subunit S [Chitinophagaceae bacterium]